MAVKVRFMPSMSILVDTQMMAPGKESLMGGNGGYWWLTIWAAKGTSAPRDGRHGAGAESVTCVLGVDNGGGGKRLPLIDEKYIESAAMSPLLGALRASDSRRSNSLRQPAHYAQGQSTGCFRVCFPLS